MCPFHEQDWPTISELIILSFYSFLALHFSIEHRIPPGKNTLMPTKQYGADDKISADKYKHQTHFTLLWRLNVSLPGDYQSNFSLVSERRHTAKFFCKHCHRTVTDGGDVFYFLNF